MPALYSHTTRTTGTIITASIYNGDHQNHIDNGVPLQLDDYSGSVGQMQTNTDPGEVGTESQATTLAGEIERLRFMIKEINGKLNGAATAQWYVSSTGDLAVADGGTGSSTASGARTNLGIALDVTGATLPVGSGGTGATTFTDAGVLIGNGTSAVQVTSAGTADQVLTSNGAGVDPTFKSKGLIGVQVFTATGTYTATSGTTSVVVEALGAGGGGGGASTTGAGQVSAGGGGGAGALARARITTGFNGVTVTIGAAGSGGTAGNNAGGNGGNTTFGSVLTAGGGTGGGGDTAHGVNSGAGSIGVGGTASGSSNLFAATGMNGHNILNFNSAVCISSGGGSTIYGSAGMSQTTTTAAAGNAATGFGAGGSGAAVAASQTQQAGGAGTAGLCIIWEYA